MNIYRPHEFGKLIRKSTHTLQVWDRKGVLKAYRSPTNRRLYTHDQLSEMMGVKIDKRITVSYCRVSSPGQKTISAYAVTKKIIKEAVSDNPDSL